MGIELGRKGDYAVRAVLNLARHNGDGRRKTREIAADMDIPEKYLPQVLGELVRAGLVWSVAGPDGGYQLARPPAEVSLLQVVEAAEGPVGSTTCVLRGGPCRWDDVCAIHFAWSDAQTAFTERLARMTFAELSEADAGLEARTVVARARHRPTVDHRSSGSSEGGRDAGRR